MTSSLAVHPPNTYPHAQPHPHHHLVHPQQMPPSAQMPPTHSYQYGTDSLSAFPRSVHIAPTPNYPESAPSRPQPNNSTHTQEHTHSNPPARKQKHVLSEEEEAAKLDSIAAEASSILLLLANNGRPPRRASSPGPQRSNSAANGYDDLEAAETISSLKNALNPKENDTQRTAPSQATTQSTPRLPHDPTLIDSQKNGISKPKSRKSSGGSASSKKSKQKTARGEVAANGSVRLPLTPPFGQQDAHYGGMGMQQLNHPPFPTPTSTPTGQPTPKAMIPVHDQPYNVTHSPANGPAQLPHGQPVYPGQAHPPSNYPHYSPQHSQMPYSVGPLQSAMAPTMLPPPSSPSHGPTSVAPPPRHMLPSGPPGMMPMQPYHSFQGGPSGPPGPPGPPQSGYMPGPPINGGLQALQQQPLQQQQHHQQQPPPPQHPSQMPPRQMQPPQPPSPRSYMNGVHMAHHQHMPMPMAPMGMPMNSSYMYPGPPGARDGRPPSHSHDRYH